MQSLWMLFASFAFSIMGVCVKMASGLYSTSEIVMYRGIVGMLFILIIMKINGGTLRTAYPLQHAWRGFVGVVALWLWFYSLGKLPLAAGMTLNYMSPIWIAAILFSIGLWRRQSRFEWGLTAAILMGFAGVTLLLRPTFGAEQWFAGVVGLISGMLSALAYLQVRKLGLMGEPEYRVVFFFSFTGMVAGMIGKFSEHGTTMFHAHTKEGFGLLLAIGVTAAAAQMAMTRAYRLGKTLVTANLQYTGIVFASMWSVLLWDDKLDPLGWLGIAIIVIGGLVSTYYNTRNATAAAAKPSVTQANDPIANEV